MPYLNSLGRSPTLGLPMLAGCYSAVRTASSAVLSHALEASTDAN